MGATRTAVTVLIFWSAATVATVSTAAAESARDESFSFIWLAPSSCPGRAEVLVRAERLVGHALSRAPGAEPIEVVATVRAEDANWLLRIDSGQARDTQRVVR